MTGYEIIEILAKAQKVECMVMNIAHSPMTADLEDLSQMVYIALMEYSDEVITDLYEKGEMDFFIARIILNQNRSNKSPFHQLFRRGKEIKVNDNPKLGKYIMELEDE